MKTALRILHLEDSPRDAELIHSALEAEGLECAIAHVKSREQFEEAIKQEPFDIILSDYGLPNYNGFEALNHAREKQPHIPFILLSGTLGEEQAVDSLKNGATDYVLKQRLTRLVPAIRRAVIEAEERAKRQGAEERAREQATLLDKAQDAIFVRDLQDRIVYWNQSSERVYGWTVAEALSRNISELFADEASPLLTAARQTVIQCGEWLGELRQTTKHGKSVIVESRWTLVRDDHGQPKSILVINTDVTEKKHIEAQFLRTQRMETIGALAGGIAHDLNNMLSPIMLGVDLLEETQTNEDNRETLNLVRTSAQRGADMVRQILTFARGVSGDHAQLDLKHVVNDMTRLAKDTFPRSIRIENSIGNELHPVRGNPTQLHQVLLNLCVNARDAMLSGGLLRIEIENISLKGFNTRWQRDSVTGEFLRIVISDTGHGIPPSIMEKLFDPFFTTKELGTGTGLGLSTAMGIVKHHGGFLDIQSETGQGTSFFVYLPRAASIAQFAPGLAQTPVPTGHGEQILLVEDEIPLLEITRLTLEGFNYRVLSATNGAEAITLYQKHRGEIHLVLTDMMMPVLDGPGTICALEKIDPAVKIISLSGLGSVAKNKLSPAVKVRASLSKPYTTSQLLTTIRTVLESQMAQAA